MHLQTNPRAPPVTDALYCRDRPPVSSMSRFGKRTRKFLGTSPAKKGKGLGRGGHVRRYYVQPKPELLRPLPRWHSSLQPNAATFERSSSTKHPSPSTPTSSAKRDIVAGTEPNTDSVNQSAGDAWNDPGDNTEAPYDVRSPNPASPRRQTQWSARQASAQQASWDVVHAGIVERYIDWKALSWDLTLSTQPAPLGCGGIGGAACTASTRLLTVVLVDLKGARYCSSV